MRIAFLGDIALIGKYDIEQNGEEAVKSRLSNIRDLLSKYDYVIANLESPLTEQTTTKEYKSMPLRSSSVNIDILKYLNIYAVSLANNHIYDYGKKGLDETIRVLRSNGIKYFGLNGELLKIEDGINPILIQGFCCFTANGWHYNATSKSGRLNSLTIENINEFIENAQRQSCFPIIMPHWGEENTHYPRTEHVLLAHSILNCHQCAIIGHHPHVAQGILRTVNGFCAFSLGNFLFDDCISLKNNLKVTQTEDNKKGYILEVTFTDDKRIDCKTISYYDDIEGLRLDEIGNQMVQQYSTTIERLFGHPQYEMLRTKEKNKGDALRLGKRDLNWLISHMNLNAIMTVIQRKMNKKAFAKVVASIPEQINAETHKNIYYIGNFGLPSSNAAGKRVYSNSKLLSICGYNVEMIGTEQVSGEGTVTLCKGIKYIGFPNYGKNNGRKYYKWLKDILNKTSKRPTMIVRYGSPGLATFDLFLYIYCKRKHIPLVVDVVDWLNIDSNNLIFKFVKSIDTYLEKAVFNKLGDGIIAISSYLHEYYRRNYKHRIIVPPLVEQYTLRSVSNPVKCFIYAGSPFRKGRRIKNVSNIKDRIDIVIQVFLTLEKKGYKFQLNIVGLTKDEYLIAFPKYRKALSKCQQIHFFGVQSMDKTQELISRMDYSILLRDKNRGTMAGFPTKVVESMSLGVPVITTNTSDLSRYIHDGINGYIVDITDRNILLNQLIDILNTSESSVKEMKKHIMDEKSFLLSNYKDNINQFVNSIINNTVE